MEENVQIEKYRIEQMLDQASSMVASKMMSAEQAVLLLGNLVDMDLREPTNALEQMFFDWLERMEKHFK
ncbi:hypothetical protein [Paenibacillus chitinolyticus]|uniref:hypothetical protein n=1 Tax=Paenibacillus chitinolyticus TaxID=79263 RepID=UPI003D089022